MKITIDRAGGLWVDGIEKFCPFSGHNNRFCGSWCALFSAQTRQPEKKTRGFAWVSLCHATHDCTLEDFTDERGGGSRDE